MKLRLTCRSCGGHIEISEKADARQDLIPKVGEYFNRTCARCHHESEYHVNDVKAYDGFGMNLIGTAIGLAIIAVVTLFAWNKGVITNVGLIIGAGIILASNVSLATSRSAAFNKYRIQATIRN
jgi:hypothetical protein